MKLLIEEVPLHTKIRLRMDTDGSYTNNASDKEVIAYISRSGRAPNIGWYEKIECPYVSDFLIDGERHLLRAWPSSEMPYKYQWTVYEYRGLMCELAERTVIKSEQACAACNKPAPHDNPNQSDGSYVCIVCKALYELNC